jgi:hypothetical protein
MAARLALVAVSLCLLSAPAQAGEQKKAGGLTYVQLPPMAAIAFRPDGRRGVLTIETGLDIKDAALRARVEAMTPRLRDAYVSSVQSYARTLGPGVPPDADRISAQLQRETDRVLGKPGAKLLLGTILVN